MLLFFIRHGDPIYNPDKLTPLGRRQAEAIAKRLAQYGLDRIYCSTSNRAIETAVPTCELLKKEMELLDWCNESHAWENLAVDNENGGMSWAFQQEKYANLFASDEVRRLDKEWYLHPEFKKTQFKEGIQRIQKETDEFLSSLGYEHKHECNAYNSIWENNEKRIALFAHQGFGLAFLSCVLDIPYPQFCTHFDMGHTGMTVIEFPKKIGAVIPKVLQLSNDSHLYKENLPLNYHNRIRF